MQRFVTTVQQEATKTKPWLDWKVTLLDAETKVAFYLQLSPTVKNYDIVGRRDQQTLSVLQQRWDILRNPDANTIFVSRKMYAPILKQLLKDYQYVEVVQNKYEKLLKVNDTNAPIAFIPIAK